MSDQINPPESLPESMDMTEKDFENYDKVQNYLNQGFRIVPTDIGSAISRMSLPQQVAWMRENLPRYLSKKPLAEKPYLPSYISDKAVQRMETMRQQRIMKKRASGIYSQEF